MSREHGDASTAIGMQNLGMQPPHTHAVHPRLPQAPCAPTHVPVFVWLCAMAMGMGGSVKEGWGSVARLQQISMYTGFCCFCSHTCNISSNARDKQQQKQQQQEQQY